MIIMIRLDDSSPYLYYMKYVWGFLGISRIDTAVIPQFRKGLRLLLVGWISYVSYLKRMVWL